MWSSIRDPQVWYGTGNGAAQKGGENVYLAPPPALPGTTTAIAAAQMLWMQLSSLAGQVAENTAGEVKGKISFPPPPCC